MCAEDTNPGKPMIPAKSTITRPDIKILVKIFVENCQPELIFFIYKIILVDFITYPMNIITSQINATLGFIVTLTASMHLIDQSERSSELTNKEKYAAKHA